ncbi:hypothetical protein BJV78DRAFT_1125031 [Lactifluus subvellereus]|nr:hypothetical protein BJV78DRAFT_1125031 [Lactifluus subvellereus]
MSTPAAAATSQIVTLPHIPELFDSNFLDVLLPPPPTSDAVASTNADADAPVPTNTFMNALKSVVHHKYTQNAAPAFSSTLSSTLDAFQSLSAGMSIAKINSVLDKAWQEDPALTLRIIWNTRSIHDGKGDKELFYKAFGWLYKHHPRTAIANLPQLVAPVCVINGKNQTRMPHGYWKDLLNILALATLDQFNSPIAEFLHTPRGRFIAGRCVGPNKMTATERHTVTPEVIEALLAAKNQKAKALARDRRIRDAANAHALLLAKLSEPRFRALYVAVARLLADELVEQAALMREAEVLPDGQERKSVLNKVSLVGKWAPTPAASHDRVTNISTALAILLHYGGAMSSLSRSIVTSVAVPKEDVHVLRSFYQRWVLTPLRTAIHIPEPLMATRRWNEVSYKHVSSKCMHINSKHFIKHDGERFDAYLDRVAGGKAKISGGTLLPHELLAKAIAPIGFEYGGEKAVSSVAAAIKARIAKREAQVVDAQWDAMIARLRSAGTLDNCLAICDVSGSMGDIHWAGSQTDPILPAVALSMTLAQLARPPFANVFITFSANPEIVVLQEGAGLAANAKAMVKSEWGMNTDLHAVFVRLLLPLAVKHRVPREDMVKRLFVFSDMQFDDADRTSKDSGAWETNHDAIARVYAEAGYDVPEVVYWNLAGELETVPVEAERKGVALMSGFSPAMMKVFMGEDAEVEVLDDDTVMVDEQGEEIKPVPRKQEMTPLSIMKRALGRASYDNLVVLD